MIAPVIVDAAWKKFRRGESHDSLRDWIPSMVRRAAGRKSLDLETEEFWALRDVSFQVNRGEALAVIGPNGAGKSTTLKMLTRILRPNKGRCVVHGRVGALIEVAAGFHPDLTGRENVYLQGAIMGMRREEIRSHFDEIVDFAGVSDFLDTPVKRYSSGMHARLGFSIAAHLEPDVLIIDEVLSVGDMAFQQKCVERAKEFKKRGIAIVFVSHNLQAVVDLCDRAIYLAREVKAIGPTKDVLAAYLHGLTAEQKTIGAVDITFAELRDTAGRSVAQTVPGAPLTMRVAFGAREAIDDFLVCLVVYRSTDNLRVYDGGFARSEIGVPSLQAGDQVTVDLDLVVHLARGQYHMQVHLFHPPTHTFLAQLNPAALLTIEEARTYGGIANLNLHARLVSVDRSRVTPPIRRDPQVAQIGGG